MTIKNPLRGLYQRLCERLYRNPEEILQPIPEQEEVDSQDTTHQPDQQKYYDVSKYQTLRCGIRSKLSNLTSKVSDLTSNNRPVYTGLIAFAGGLAIMASSLFLSPRKPSAEIAQYLAREERIETLNLKDRVEEILRKQGISRNAPPGSNNAYRKALIDLNQFAESRMGFQWELDGYKESVERAETNQTSARLAGLGISAASWLLVIYGLYRRVKEFEGGRGVLELHEEDMLGVDEEGEGEEALK